MVIDVEIVVVEVVFGNDVFVLCWQVVVQVCIGSLVGEYLFESGGVYLVESVCIDLLQFNIIVKVSL